MFTGLSLQATREELDIAQTVQITERFTRAVEHLGDEETMDVRLGAVLALERIARDSAADREAVGQLLTAFVRRKRPADESCVQGIGREHADVGAALRVLSSGQLTVAPDLSHTCLSGVDLRAARLRCAQLVGANLRGADLSDATLTDAHLEGADLRGAHLMEANLHGADLSRARLKGAHISGSTFGSPAAADTGSISARTTTTKVISSSAGPSPRAARSSGAAVWRRSCPASQSSLVA